MAEKGQSAADQQSQEVGSGKKGKGKLLFIVLGAIVVLGAGGFLGWNHLKGAAPSPEKAPPPAPPPVVSLKPFVVNLMSATEAPRYLKLEFDLELRPGSQVKELESRMSELRDSIIVLLGSKRYEDLASIEGKDRLKEEIISRVNTRLQGATASRVFFKEFIIQ